MKFQSKFVRMTLLSIALLLMSAGANYAQSEEISFKVYNRTNTTIKQLLVSQDGKNYKYFDIGKGIRAGTSVTLVWDESSYEDNCVQWFKAVYADNSESKPAKFDFCEDELELEFTE